MKRWFAAALLCLLLCGCGGYAQGLRDPVTFYYVRADYREDMSDPIGSERREASGHQNDLAYLLSLYLMGPVQSDLYAPLPRGTKVLALERSGEELRLALTDTEEKLSEAEFSLACACLSRTVLGLTQAQTVTVTSGGRSVTMTRDNVSTYDTPEETGAEEETQ